MGRECLLRDETQVRGQGQVVMRQCVANGSVVGTGNWKLRITELHTVEAGSLKVSLISEVTTLQHSTTIDVHSEGPFRTVLKHW